MQLQPPAVNPFRPKGYANRIKDIAWKIKGPNWKLLQHWYAKYVERVGLHSHSSSSQMLWSDLSKCKCTVIHEVQNPQALFCTEIILSSPEVNMRLTLLELYSIPTILHMTNRKYLSATVQQVNTVQANKKGKFELKRLWKTPVWFDGLRLLEPHISFGWTLDCRRLTAPKMVLDNRFFQKH